MSYLDTLRNLTPSRRKVKAIAELTPELKKLINENDAVYLWLHESNRVDAELRQLWCFCGVLASALFYVLYRVLTH